MTDQSSTRMRMIARIRKDTTSEFEEATLEEFTPLGVRIEPKNSGSYAPGNDVEIELLQHGSATIHEGIVIQSAHECIVRFVPTPSPSQERRRDSRWICPAFFLPTAISPTPGEYNEFVTFQVKNFSNRGLELLTDSDNSFLVQGMMLRLTISLPLVGNATTLTKIVRNSLATVGGKESISLGTEIIDMDTQSRELVANYLLQFSNLPNPDSLIENRAGDYRWPDMTCSQVTQAQEFRSLMQQSRDFSSASSDLLARIVAIQKNKEIVGWASYKFLGVASQSEGSGRFSNRPEQTTEITNLRVSEKESVKIATALLSFLTDSCTDSQRTFFCIKDHNVPTWVLAASGFELDSESGCFLGEPKAALMHPSVQMSLWNLVWERPTSRLYDANVLHLDGIAKRIFLIFKLFSPLTYVLFWLTRKLTIDKGEKA